MVFSIVKKVQLLIYALLVLSIISTVQVQAAQQAPQANRFVNWAAENAERAARIHAEREEQRARRVQDHVDEINRLAERGLGEHDPRVINLRAQIAEQNRARDNNEKWQDLDRELIKGFGGVIMNNLDKKRQQEELRIQGENDKATAVAETTAKIQAIFEQLRDPKTLAYLAGGTLAVFGVYYSLKLLHQHIEATMGKPTLVKDSSRKGLGEILTNFIMGYEEPEYKISDIVLSPEVQAKATILAEDTKETREYGLPYQNVLFYGPPGTGKTEFAKIISHYSGMDYAIMSGADFAQFKGGEAIVELHKLFEWAKNSPNGSIIFIDEADACLGNRATQGNEGVNFVNAFLAQTGSQSDKFMIILATNYEDELDAAVRSRIHKKVPFLLPSLEDRFMIIKKKMDKYLFNDTRTFTKDDQEVTVHLSVANDVNDSYIEMLAEKLEGFSGRDIDQMVAEVRLRAYRSGKNLVTREIATAVATDKKNEIEKDRKATEYQRQKLAAAAA